MYGPEPPPGFVDQPPSPPPASSKSSDAVIEAVPPCQIVGPLPAEHRALDELRHASSRFEDELKKQKQRDGADKARREEWMLVPPEALAPSLLATGRKRSAVPDKSWTKVAGRDEAADDSEDDCAEDSLAAAERKQRLAFETEGARLRDAEMEKLAAATAGGADSRSLLQQHRDKLAKELAELENKKKKKKEKKEKKKKDSKKKKFKKKRSRKSSSSSDSSTGPSRVPFNRDTDLAIKGLDSKVKQSIVAKSQAGMASRFSHGGQKYL